MTRLPVMCWIRLAACVLCVVLCARAGAMPCVDTLQVEARGEDEPFRQWWRFSDTVDLSWHSEVCVCLLATMAWFCQWRATILHTASLLPGVRRPTVLRRANTWIGYRAKAQLFLFPVP